MQRRMKIWKKQERGSTHPRPSISPFTVHHRGFVSGAAATDHHHTARGGLHAHIKDAKVLMVGAGGIGCDLLKTLALSVFTDIHIGKA